MFIEAPDRHKKPRSSDCSSFLAFLITASCKLGPDFKIPGQAVDQMKESWQFPGARLPDTWWRLFRDAELNACGARWPRTPSSGAAKVVSIWSVH